MFYRYLILASMLVTLVLANGIAFAENNGKGNPGDTVPPEIDALVERVDVVEGDISTLQTDLGTLQGEVTSLDGELGTVQTELMTLQGEVTSLDGELGMVDSRLIDLEDGFSAIASSRFIFVTHTAYTGNLGGLEGADQKCQAAANNAGLDGTFLAWISTWAGPIIGKPSTDPQSRFIRHNTPYILPISNIKVADNYADFVDGTLDAPINSDEFGATLFSPALTWSTTVANGRGIIGASGTSNCENWTTDAILTSATFLGTVGVTDFYWSAPGMSAAEPCGNSHHLLCVQQ